MLMIGQWGDCNSHVSIVSEPPVETVNTTDNISLVSDLQGPDELPDLAEECYEKCKAFSQLMNNTGCSGVVTCRNPRVTECNQ